MPRTAGEKQRVGAYMLSLIELVEPFPTDKQRSPSVPKREHFYIIGAWAGHTTEFDLS
jgi:hypothetical protein